MKKLNVAIIGQGRSGRNIHGTFFLSEDNTKFNVVAVVDALEHRREKAKREFNCDVYSDYTELFGRNDIDIVVNASFSQMHSDITIDLLNHGFNVIVEKPFARNYEDGCRVIAAAEKNGKMVNAFQQSRFAPYFTKIQEIVASGKLGELIQVSISFSGFARRWDWQTSKAFAGGNVRNTGPHPLDQAMNFLDFSNDVSVFSKLACVNTFGDAEDYAKIILTAPNKPLIDLEISSCNAYSPATYIIHAKNGSLKASMAKIEYKYFDPSKAPEQKQILTPLMDENGDPMYCGETLDWIEETVEVEGTAFNVGTRTYYDMIYDFLVNGKEMSVTPYQLLPQLKVIDLIHAQNPLDVKAD